VAVADAEQPRNKPETSEVEEHYVHSESQKSLSRPAPPDDTRGAHPGSTVRGGRGQPASGRATRGLEAPRQPAGLPESYPIVRRLSARPMRARAFRSMMCRRPIEPVSLHPSASGARCETSGTRERDDEGDQKREDGAKMKRVSLDGWGDVAYFARVWVRRRWRKAKVTGHHQVSCHRRARANGS
jgi:hypothetical protein